MHRIPGTEIVLRKFEPEYLDSLWNFRNDLSVANSLGGFSTGYSKRDLLDWMESHRNRNDEVLYAIVDDEKSVCIGHVGLYEIDHRNRKAEFAILLGMVQYQGKGLGEMITRYMVSYGFRQLNLNKVSLTVISENNRAISLYEKVGFRNEGVSRQDLWRDDAFHDVLSMSILRDEWLES